MSVKFEKETKETLQKAVDKVQDTFHPEKPLPGTSGKHPISEAIGTAITGGKKNAGSKGYLAVRLTLPRFRHACEIAAKTRPNPTRIHH